MIKEMYQRGMSITDIANELKMDRKTVKKYIMSENIPTVRKRNRSSKLKSLGYQGGKTILKDYMQPFREQAKKKYTVRYETLPGEQMQVHWKEVGEIILNGEKWKLSMFVAILGYCE